MVNYGFDGRYITNQNFSQGAKGRPDGSDPSWSLTGRCRGLCKFSRNQIDQTKNNYIYKFIKVSDYLNMPGILVIIVVCSLYGYSML
jgi:hypothetical protein